MATQSVRPVGWTTQAARPAQDSLTASDVIVDILRESGVEHAFGIVGGGIAPFAEALFRSPMSLWHTRHESGAAFSATEAFFATGHPTAIFVTTGPGLLNALTGIAAARWDGAKLVVISGGTTASQRGRGAVQETSSFSMPGDLYAPGRLFDYAITPADLGELAEMRTRLLAGFSRPQGFVAHVNFPLNLQTASLTALPPIALWSSDPAGCGGEVLDECVKRMSSNDFAIWVGFGARHASREVRELAERTGAAVMSSPRAKGIFPEEHPQFVGVTGAGGHMAAEQYVQEHRPAFTLVLGSRLGEVTSFWGPNLVPREGFIHVDLEPSAFGAAYPTASTMGVQAEIGEFLRALLAKMGDHRPRLRRTVEPLGRPPVLEPRGAELVRPQYVMQVLQHEVVDRSDATLMTESGNSFGWGNQLLRFSEPGRYRTSAAFGSMGHFVTGVVGAALARAGKAVAVVGDGAMLMNNEVSTAVQYGAQAVWVVLNDSLYGITHQAMPAQGFLPVETKLPTTDFVAFARSMGADGVRVETEQQVEAAVRSAMEHDGPFVVDVQIDPTQVTPVLKRRIESLKRQGATKDGAER